MTDETVSLPPCPFCEIVAGRAEATYRAVSPGVGMIIVPLHPVTTGHVMVIPEEHVEDFTTDPSVTAEVMVMAANYAKAQDVPMNLITSKGEAATQSVMHLHAHLVPRHEGDGLHLPWTGQHDRGKAPIDRLQEES